MGTPAEPYGHVMEFSRWQDHGSCTEAYGLVETKEQLNTLDLIFFGKPGRPAIKRQYALYCDDCPVRQLCLEDAIVHDPEFGVWGGMSKLQRRTFMSTEQAFLMRDAIERGWLQYEFLSDEGKLQADAIRAQIRKEQKLAELQERQASEYPQAPSNLVFQPRQPRVLRIEAS